MYLSVNGEITYVYATMLTIAILMYVILITQAGLQYLLQVLLNCTVLHAIYMLQNTFIMAMEYL